MRFFYFTKCNHLCTRLFFKPTCISKCVPWVWQISPREVVARFGPIIVRTWITQRCIFFHPIDNFPQLIFFCGSRGVYRGFPQGFGGGEGEILIVVTHATRPVVPSMQRDVFQTTFTCNFIIRSFSFSVALGIKEVSPSPCPLYYHTLMRKKIKPSSYKFNLLPLPNFPSLFLFLTQPFPFPNLTFLPIK